MDAVAAALWGSAITGTVAIVGTATAAWSRFRLDKEQRRHDRIERAYLKLSTFMAEMSFFVRDALDHRDASDPVSREIHTQYIDALGLAACFASPQVLDALDAWSQLMAEAADILSLPQGDMRTTRKDAVQKRIFESRSVLSALMRAELGVE